MDSPSEFPLFPLLPKEIRLKIWRHAGKQHKRIIYFYWNSSGKLLCHNEPIPLLSVDREARDEILKSYTKIEGIEDKENRNDAVFRNPLYVNSFHDTIKLDIDGAVEDFDWLVRGFERNGIALEITSRFDDEEYQPNEFGICQF